MVQDIRQEVVGSVAKWKVHALQKYFKFNFNFKQCDKPNITGGGQFVTPGLIAISHLLPLESSHCYPNLWHPLFPPLLFRACCFINQESLPTLVIILQS